jgi:signal transduction histidine kinase
MTDYFFQQATIVIISTTLILLTVLLNIVYRNISGVKQYALGSFLLQVAMLMFLSSLSKQGYIPVLIMANLGFILAVTLQLEGIARFFGEKIQIRRVYIFSLALSIVYIYFTAFELNTTAQLIIMNFGLSAYYIKLLIIFLSDASKRYITSKLFFIPALVFSISILISRGLNTILPEGLSLSKFTNQFLSEGAFFITSLYIVGFFVMAAEYQKIKLIDYNEKISKESYEKSILLRFISHEVRNNIGSISMKIELMKSNDNYSNNEKLAEDLDLISQVTKQLDSLTVDVLSRSNYKKIIK